jgi:hypothetical protein
MNTNNVVTEVVVDQTVNKVKKVPKVAVPKVAVAEVAEVAVDSNTNQEPVPKKQTLSAKHKVVLVGALQMINNLMASEKIDQTMYDMMFKALFYVEPTEQIIQMNNLDLSNAMFTSTIKPIIASNKKAFKVKVVRAKKPRGARKVKVVGAIVADAPILVDCGIQGTAILTPSVGGLGQDEEVDPELQAMIDAEFAELKQQNS